MKLNQFAFDVNGEYSHTLYDPISHQDTDITFTIVHPESDRARNRYGPTYKKMFSRAMKGKNALTTETTQDDAYKTKAAATAACVIGWDGIKDAAGSPVLYSDDACNALFTDRDNVFVLDQIHEALQSADSFLSSNKVTGLNTPSNAVASSSVAV